MNKYAGLGLGLSVGLPLATASYFLSGMFDKKDKHSLARAIGSILLGTAAGFGANALLDAPVKGKIKVIKDTDPEIGADLLTSLARASELHSSGSWI